MLALAPTAAMAISLPEILARSYQSNPTIAGARADQRATDEGVIAAKSAALPALSANASYDEFLQRGSNDSTAPRRLFSAGLQASMPLFAGGATISSIKSAEARVRAGRETLRGTEAQIMVDTASVYADVLTNQMIVDFYAQQMAILDENISYAQSGFDHGDLTKTDIEQARARREAAEGQLESAQANLTTSREDFLRLSGIAPENLEPLPELPGLPASADQALDYALDHNPGLLGAREASQVARYQIGVAAASRLPRVDVVANAGYSDYFKTFGGGTAALFDQTSRTSSLGVRATLPLYQGGLPAARIREAKATLGRTMEEITAAERLVSSQARSYFYRLEAARRSADAAQRAIVASEHALTGIRAELKAGTRTIIDLLNAEQEVLNARIQLAQAQRETFVAGFTLLAIMGRADPESLAIGTPNYDPAVHYKKVRNSFWDFGTGPAVARMSAESHALALPASAPALSISSSPAPVAPPPAAPSPSLSFDAAVFDEPAGLAGG